MSRDERPPILIVKEVSKSFGGLQAVNRASFDVSPGSITGLIGPNGAGKTTLFNLISGFMSPDSGEIHFDGERIDRLAAYQVFRRGLVRTFQIPRELASMTVIENLMLVPTDQAGEQLWNTWFLPWRVSREEDTNFDKAEGVLRFLNLSHLRDEYAANLSGGQKKLLELGRTLMSTPKMVLLDEPAAGVNRVLMRQIVDDIKRLREELGITFFVIEHDMDVIAWLCDELIVMSEGAKLAEGPPDEVRADPRVLEAYLGGHG